MPAIGLLYCVSSELFLRKTIEKMTIYMKVLHQTSVLFLGSNQRPVFYRRQIKLGLRFPDV